MCIAGALGIPGSTGQRTPTRNCFVSQKDGCSVTAWGYCVQYGKKSHWFTSSSAKYKAALENNILSLCACQAFCWNGGYTKVLCTLYSPIDVMGSKLSHYGSLEEQHILTKIGCLSRKINIVINSTVSVLEDQLKLDSLCTSCNAVAQCLLNIDLITP